MKIYILPYTLNKEVLLNKRASGVDEAMLNQIRVLKHFGHDVRCFVPFGDLPQTMDCIDFFSDQGGFADIKKYARQNKQRIIQTMVTRIKEFKPDVILTNHFFDNKLYEKLMHLGIPVLYNSHAVPGFFSDLNSGNNLNDFQNLGHSIACVSKYAKGRFESYYGAGRDCWNFDKIAVDHIIYPSYIEQYPIAKKGKSDLIIHVSAANKQKATFRILDAFVSLESDWNPEVYTTVNYLGGKTDEYVELNMKAYSDYIHLDVDHSEIVSRTGEAAVAFVGLASYDTFTITSLEALSQGVPLILKGYKGYHPAFEMVDEQLHKYLQVCKTNKEMYAAAEAVHNLDISERQKIAASCYKLMNRDSYYQRLNTALCGTIEKYKDQNKPSGLGSFFG